MSKKVFVIIVALMSISLIGIILVQLYWIDNAVKSKKAQFKNEVQKSLGSVSQKIISKEELEFEKQIPLPTVAPTRVPTLHSLTPSL